VNLAQRDGRDVGVTGSTETTSHITT